MENNLQKKWRVDYIMDGDSNVKYIMAENATEAIEKAGIVMMPDMLVGLTMLREPARKQVSYF